MRKRILHAVGAELLGKILTIGIRLLLVPIFLSSWGSERYGEWIILTAVAAWFSLGDLGGQLYFVNRLTTAWAANEIEEFQNVLSSGMALFFGSSAFLFLIVLIGLAFCPLTSWFNLHVVDLNQARIILAIMAFRFLVALPVGLLLGIYRSIGMQSRSVMYVNVMLAIQFVSSALVLKFNGGMSALAALEVIPFLVVAALVLRDLKSRLPAAIKILSIRNCKAAILKKAISPSLHFLSIQLAMAFIIQGTIIVVGKTLGPVEVVVFSTLRTVSNVASQFLGMVSHSAWPEFTRLQSTKQIKKLSELFKSILLLSFLASVVYVFTLQNFGEFLFKWWLSNKLPFNRETVFLMGVLVTFTTLWTLGGNLLMATNLHEAFAKIQIPINLFALILCYFGAIHYGSPGAISGLIAGQSLLMLVAVIYITNQKGWGTISSFLTKISIASLLLLPMCLNPWTGLVSVGIVLWLFLKQSGWKTADHIAVEG